MNRTRLATFAAVAALALGGLGYWLGRRQPEAPPVAVEAAVVAPAPAVGASAAPARASVTRPAAPAPVAPPARIEPKQAAAGVLPPPNSPVASTYDQLALRARSGDARAACRLANDLSACRQLAILKEQRDGFDRSLLAESSKPKPSDQRLKQMLTQQDQLSARIADSERQCGGLTPERIDEAFDWLKLAADQGHVPSMARFAIDPLIPPNLAVRDLDRLMLYRINAPRYAMAALAAGNGEIVAALADAYRTKSPTYGTFLAQVLPADPVQALAYSLLARRISPINFSAGTSDPLELQRADLDAGQQSEAQRVADDLYGRYYAGRTVQRAPTTPFDSGTWMCERDR